MLYRLDRQKRIATPLTTTGKYVWTNVYYFEANNPSEYSAAKTSIFQGDNSVHCNVVELGAFRIAEWPSNVQVERVSSYPSHNSLLPGTPGPLTNTVLAHAKCSDGTIYYKRYRVPLREADFGDFAGLLSSAAYSFFASHCQIPATGGYLRNQNGATVGSISLSPFVHVWQLRHGTKRSARATLI